MSVLVDTGVLVDVLRARTPEQRLTAQHFRALAPGAGPVAVSVVSIAELTAGVRPAELGPVNALLALLDRVPVEEAIAARAGAYLREFRRSHSVELGDALVAATAVERGLPLWTANRKHFPMSELRWWDPPD